MALALIAALLAAVGYSCATLLQATSARRATGLAAAVAPLALAGWVIDVASRLMAVLAFQRLSLFVVEAVLSMQLIGIVVGAWIWLGLRPRLWDALAAVVIVVAVVLLCLGWQTHEGGSGSMVAQLSCMAAGACLLVVLLATYRRGSPVVMAVLSGLGYSISAVSSREAILTGGLVHIIFQPCAAAMVMGGVCGGLALIRALERSGADGVAAVTGVIGVLVPGLIGLLLLCDVVQPGWEVVTGLAVVATLGGCVVLARGPVGRLTG